MFTRENAVRLLGRGPGALNSRIARLTVLALTATGAGFLVWSGVIHLMLWSEGYKDISWIGPLFLLQGIVCIVLAVAVVAFRWLALIVAGAVTGVATAVGLLLSVNFGLFGFTESLSVPYAELSLAVEFTAGFVLLVAACLLALARPARITARQSPVATRRNPIFFGLPSRFQSTGAAKKIRFR